MAVFHLIVFTCFHSNFVCVCLSCLLIPNSLVCTEPVSKCVSVFIDIYETIRFPSLIDMLSTCLWNKGCSTSQPPKHLLHLTLNKHSKNLCWEILSHKTPSVLLSSSFLYAKYMTGSDTIRKNRERSANQVNRDLWPISVRANIAALCFDDIKDIFFYEQHNDIQRANISAVNLQG